MAYKDKATFWTETNAKFVSGSNPWGGQELDNSFEDMKDSVAWNETPAALTIGTTTTWDVDTGLEKTLSLTQNTILAISNLPTGEGTIYGRLRVTNTGSFSITAYPAGSKTNGGSINLGSGAVTNITFAWDGTNLDVAIVPYS